MALSTHSKFFFDYEVDANSNSLDIDEGSGELNLTLDVGSYTLTEIATLVENKLNNDGTLTYTVTVDRSTRKITIAASAAFDLLITSGAASGTSIYSTIGFTGADLTGLTSYEGDAAGSEYTTQFVLQDYVSSDNKQEAADAVVNESASGQVEVITYGLKKFIKANFRFITDRDVSGSCVLRNRPSGVSDFRTFIQFMTTKSPFEFMPDEDTPATFEKVLLEKSPQSSNGTSYEIKELFAQNLPGFYESGSLTFRVQE